MSDFSETFKAMSQIANEHFYHLLTVKKVSDDPETWELHLQKYPQTLGVNVRDTIKANDKFGG